MDSWIGGPISWWLAVRPVCVAVTRLLPCPCHRWLVDTLHNHIQDVLKVHEPALQG